MENASPYPPMAKSTAPLYNEGRLVLLYLSTLKVSKFSPKLIFLFLFCPVEWLFFRRSHFFKCNLGSRFGKLRLYLHLWQLAVDIRTIFGL